MTDTPQQIPYKITHRDDQARVLFVGKGTTVKEALQEAVAVGANLARANLAGANLDGANLDGANLARAYLARANLVGAYLARANLDGANLDGANLAGAYLAGANLARANLARAYLARANLDGANLDGANLDGANLDGAPDAEGKPTKDKIAAIASVQFTGHGQCGRTLLGIACESGAIHLRCGCFTGSPKALRQYIAQAGGESYVKTRTLALKTVLALLKAKNP